MQNCFESKDISLLQKVVLELPKGEAEYHMKRCVDSGLWVPNASDLEDGHGVQEQGDGEEDPEEIYEKLH